VNNADFHPDNIGEGQKKGLEQGRSDQNLCCSASTVQIVDTLQTGTTVVTLDAI
jgi:hypothetical protein